MVKMVEENPFVPIAWQKDHKGMQGTEYLTGDFEIQEAKATWLITRDKAVHEAKNLNRIGVTKQLCNRILEPFMWHTVIVTANKEAFDHFFDLRCPQYCYFYKDDFGEKEYYKSKKDLLKHFEKYPEHKSLNEAFKNLTDLGWSQLNDSQADIHIQGIAELMYDAMNESTPKQLQAGEYHIPFGDNFDENLLDMKHWVGDNTINKVKIATARCARISYETLGDNPKIDYEADIRLHDMLLASKHLSPFEHCAKAMSDEEYYYDDRGIGLSPKMAGWCRNFRGFIQYRHIVEQ
jgi:hypothetical protein